MVANWLPPLDLEELDVEAEALELADQNVEGFRETRGFRHFTLHDRLVHLAAPFHIVALDGEQLLERVGRAVRLQGPHLHLAEALAAELRLAAQRLLGDERVGSDRARVDLVVHQMRELQHVDVAHGHLLLERLSGHPVEQRRLARFRQVRLFEEQLDVGLARAVEHRRGEFQTESAAGPPQVRLQDLADVHPARHAERVEHDLHRRPIGEVRHVLLRQDPRDHALVAVASGHLVADLELALHRDVDLDQLDDARRQLVALLQETDALLVDPVQHLDVGVRLLVDDLHGVDEPPLVDRQTEDLLAGQPLQGRLLDRITGLEQLLARTRLDRSRHLLPHQVVADLLVALLGEDSHLVLDVLLKPGDLVRLDLLGAHVLLDTLAREDLDVDDRPFDARWYLEAGVADVARLLAEDGAEQLLHGSELGLALRRDLAHQNVARLDRGADADDAALVQVLQGRLGDVRDVPGDLFWSQFSVAGLDLELLDVDGGVVVLPHPLLGDQDRVLEVVAAPGHEGHQHVPAESELTLLGAWSVGQHVPLAHPQALGDDRLLGDAGVLVRAAELDELVDVGAEVLRLAGLQVLSLHTHDDALGVHRVDDAAPLAEDDRARVLGHDPFEAGADDRRVAAQQRHGLPLHVRAHESAVRIVVLEERDECRGHRNELLRADVDVVEAVALDVDEVAAGPRAHPVVDEVAPLVEPGVRLGDDVLLLFPGGEIEGMRLGVDPPLARLLQTVVLGLEVVPDDDLPQAEAAVPDLQDAVVVEHAAVLDPLVRALDEPVVVDPRVGGKRRDEADVRTFRRLDRADAAVVRGVDVAHLEPGPLARQTARSQGRQTALVRDLGQRVRLVHELRELRRAEELLDRRDDRLRVDQVVRHRRVDVLVDGHLLLDRPLHAHQADAELVLQELADRAHAAVAQVVDVVHAAGVLLQAQQVLVHAEEVVRREGLLIDRHLGVELDVELEAADPREVVALGVEEHAVEERAGALQGRGIARAHAAVDLDQRLARVLRRVLGQRVRQRRAGQLPVREKDLDRGVVAAVHPLLDVLGHELVRLEDHLAGVQVDHVADEIGALQLLGADVEGQGLAGVELADQVFGQDDAGEDRVRLAAAAALAVLQALRLQ